MKIQKWSLAIFLFIVCGSSTLFAQDNEEMESDTTKDSKGRIIDELTYENHAGLPKAASKIYFSDQKFTLSGFGETSYIHYNGPKDIASEDLELYMTNLYRFVTYAAYKPTPWLVLYGEIFAELLQDGNREFHTEYFIEAFADFTLSKHFNMRLGTHQVQIGYVNNNDEPIDYYSVNRPEVERLIIPSQWIDLGVMTYGQISNKLSYSFSVYQGLDSRAYNGGTWIRRGRDEELRFNFNSAILNGQLNYYPRENLSVSLSGLWTQGGNNERLTFNGQESTVRGNTMLLSSYVRQEYKNWSFMLLGSYGTMDETDKIYHLTQPVGDDGNVLGPGQVMGSEVFGYYLEVGYDLIGAIRKKEVSGDGNLVFKPKEFKLPLFARIEHLNTHSSVHESLRSEERFQRDLKALTLGVNFNPRKSIVLKANYQFRWNRHPLTTGEMEGDRIEVGMGFIF